MLILPLQQHHQPIGSKLLNFKGYIMAFRKIIEVEGKSIVHTTIGDIQNGTQRVSFFAYVKVINVNGGKTTMNAIVYFKGENQEFTKEYQIPVSVVDSAPNFIKQAYEHLKTLPEFTNAEDC
jgi:hypothetical protein